MVLLLTASTLVVVLSGQDKHGDLPFYGHMLKSSLSGYKKTLKNQKKQLLDGLCNI